MNYEPIKLKNKNLIKDTEYHLTQAQKTETSLHTKTFDNLRQSNDNLTKLYKPKLTNLKSSSQVSFFPKNLTKSNISSSVDNKVTTFESAFSLQKATYKYTFPKSIRFNHKPVSNDIIYNLRTEPDRRGTSIGYGNKVELASKSSKNVPSPSDYKIRSIFEQNLLDKKGYVIGVKTKELFSESKVPGPGAYNINVDNLIHKVPVSLKSRLMFFYDEDVQRKKFSVSPQKYYPNMKLVKPNRYNEVGIGSGKRTITQSIGVSANPGPGAHNLPSIFDMNSRTKFPLN